MFPEKIRFISKITTAITSNSKFSTYVNLLGTVFNKCQYETKVYTKIKFNSKPLK